MTEEIKFHSSCENIFAKLGLPNPDELLIKAELVHQISEIISTCQLTKSEASELLAIDPLLLNY